MGGIAVGAGGMKMRSVVDWRTRLAARGKREGCLACEFVLGGRNGGPAGLREPSESGGWVGEVNGRTELVPASEDAY